MCTNACREKGKPAETLPAEGIGCIPVARGHREGSGDCAECHWVWLGGEGRRNRKGYVSEEGERTSNKEEVWSMHPSEPSRIARRWAT